MALSSASPQIANVKDGEKSPPGDLEEGEIEDGELPDEEGEEETGNSSKAKEEQPHGSVNRSVVKVEKSSDKHEKPNDLGRLNRRKTNHNPDRNIDQEEEWACVVEKKLKAAIGKDSGNEDFNGSSAVVSAEKSYVEDDKRSRRKKRKKKHKDDEDDDKKESKKRKKSHHWGGEDAQESSTKDKSREGEDGEEDDDEMLYVRGASPVAREGFNRSESPSKFGEKVFSFNQQGGFDENYDSDYLMNEEDSDFESREEFKRCNPSISDDDAPKRGLGRGPKRRQRSVGRPLPHKRQTRKDTKSKRGGLKRQQSSRSNSEREPNVCMFFMQGKCQKGEECPYSHNACPPRKMELCKFYLMDCCAKKDKCLYMHHDFPCKFFHTGLKCFSGPRCKFSHGQLSEAMRSILLKGTEGNRHNELRLSNRPSVPSQEHRSKHLETAPKELLGDFPRLSREGAAAMVYNKKNRSSKAKKIPSLFDIEVPIPAQLLEQNEGAKDQSPRRTPMPESDNEDQDGTTTPMPLSPVNDSKSKSKSRWGSDDVHGSLSRDSKDDDNQSRNDDEESKPLIPKFYQETDPEGGSKNKTDSDHGKINLHRFAGYSPNPAEEKKAFDSSSSDKTVSEDKELKKKTDDKISQKDAANGDSGTESNDATNIPLHLPKKQRELFLRIQQQQREADSSQDQSGDHDDEVDAAQEENWYSSDDEEDSLTNVLKNLSRQETPPTSQIETSCSAKEAQVEPRTSAPNLPMKIPDLSKIKIDESFTKLLSSICGKKTSEESNNSVVTTAIEVPAPVPVPAPAVPNSGLARDPRLSRDPRNRSHASAAASSVGGGVATVLETTATSSPNIATTTHSSSFDGGRRTDPRRALDPRSAKSSQDHKHSSSGSSRRSSSHSSYPSIYSNAIMGEKTSNRSGGLGLSVGGSSTGDVDLRNFLPRTLETGDVDLRSRGDTDLRTSQPSTSLGFGDTDLRVRSHDLLNVGQVDCNRSNNDVDLRRLDLPFKPVPMHTPATEIEASLTSHPPIPYKVVVVTIPRPDYSNLKLNTSDPQVQSDPRLRKIFKIHSPGLDNPIKTTTLGSSLTSVPRNDPRRQSSRSSGSGVGVSGGGSSSNIANSVSGSSNTLVSNDHHDHSSEPFGGSPSLNVITKQLSEKNSPILLPNTGIRSSNSGSMVMPASSPLLPNPTQRRDPRSAPGLLGPAPLPANYCPNTPVFEEHVDVACGLDNDPRVIFNRGPVEGVRWEQHTQGSAQLPRNNNWRSNRRTPQSYHEDPRSYTPPI